MKSPSNNKRRRRNEECERCSSHRAKKKKKHLYLVVDDWEGGYSIHKLDADNMEHHLPEHGVLRLASSPKHAPMAFGALGSNIFIATNPHCSRHRAPPFLVYDTESAALTVGPPPPPGGHLRDLGDAVAVGGKLYALTFFFCDDEALQTSSLQVLSWEPTTDREEAWDPTMAWSWDTLPAPPPFTGYETITSYALHPDGRTIFMSTGWRTHSLDTGNGAWRDLGEWTLPFRGQAYFDGELDAWVGLHHKEDGYICCCPVASRSATTVRQPECEILKEKMFRRYGRYLSATLTYMGDSKFCLVESVLRSKDALEAALHVTVFGLKYDHKRELKTKTHRTTRFYGLSKNTLLFSHATFWM
ncbi:unnamed protein product [Urochloa humidicola]